MSTKKGSKSPRATASKATAKESADRDDSRQQSSTASGTHLRARLEELVGRCASKKEQLESRERELHRQLQVRQCPYFP